MYKIKVLDDSLELNNGGGGGGEINKQKIQTKKFKKSQFLMHKMETELEYYKWLNFYKMIRNWVLL